MWSTLQLLWCLGAWVESVTYLYVTVCLSVSRRAQNVIGGLTQNLLSFPTKAVNIQYPVLTNLLHDMHDFSKLLPCTFFRFVLLLLSHFYHLLVIVLLYSVRWWVCMSIIWHFIVFYMSTNGLVGECSDDQGMNVNVGKRRFFSSFIFALIMNCFAWVSLYWTKCNAATCLLPSCSLSHGWVLYHQQDSNTAHI